MSVSFLTSLNEQEFKTFLKEAMKELMKDQAKQQPASDMPMNVEQAAAFLDLEVTTIYEKTSRKEIPHSKKGNKLYFDRAELLARVRSGRIKTRLELQSEAATRPFTK